MPVEFLDDEAIADIAFIIKSKNLHSLFVEACETIFRLQTDTSKVENKISFSFETKAVNYERLLYNVLSEILYFRDAEIFFASSVELQLENTETGCKATGTFYGDEFDESLHTRGNEVKAITMHDFYLKETNEGFEAYILVDI